MGNFMYYEASFFVTSPLCFSSKNSGIFGRTKKKRYLCAYKTLKTILTMSLIRVILCIIFPPLAVYDKGCGSILITLLLTCIGWVPGVIAALVINNNKK